MAEVSEPQVADLAECLAALEALSDTELRTLNSYARLMAYSVKGTLPYADANDLLHEAIARTLDGKRKWKPQQVDFVTHLKGCMRSIADEYAEELLRRIKAPPRDAPPPKERYWDESIFDATRRCLKGDELALAVFDRLLYGHSPAEIRQMLSMKTDVYNAARKRISRCLQKVFSDGV